MGGINAKLHCEITTGFFAVLCTPHSTRHASISKARLHVPRETRQKAGGGAAYIHSQKHNKPISSEHQYARAILYSAN